MSRWDGRILFLRGPSRTGKTSLAAAAIRDRFASDPTAMFLTCDEIAPERCDREPALKIIHRAEKARFLVLDDLGQDLDGAPAGGGISAMRGARARRIIRARHNDGERSLGFQTVITSAFDDRQIRESYGDDIFARLTERRSDVRNLWLDPCRCADCERGRVRR